jgi:hypothetical protein
MSHIVFILGAGASVHAGCPVMATFWSKAQELFRHGKLPDEGKAFRAVDEVRSQLQYAFVKAKVDIDNVESIFCLIEMAEVVGRLRNHERPELVAARVALQTLIGQVLEGSMRFLDGPTVDGIKTRAPSHAYQTFVNMLRAIKKTPGGPTAAVLTFNYDIGLDFALAHQGPSFDYCLDNASNGAIPLCKLHGSLNWTSGENGTEPIRVIPMTEVVKDRSGRPVHQIRMADYAHLLKQENAGTNFVPFIVPPTDSKMLHRRQISKVWEAAADQLRKASSIYVMGYSMPETDEFFRNFLAIATIGDTVLDRFMVIDPDGSLGSRYSRLLDGRAKSRFGTQQYTFEESAPILLRQIASDYSLSNLSPR